MQNKQILAILSSIFITLAFVALVLKQKENTPTNEVFLSQDDFDYTIRAHINQISAIELADEIMKQESFYWIIDFRDSLHFANYNIPTSINLKIEQLLKNDLKINHRIYLIDLYEEKAIQAYYLLNIRGFFDVQLLKGGMNAWQNEVLFPNESAIEENMLLKRKKISDYFGGELQSENSKKKLLKNNQMIKKRHPFQIGC